MFKPVISYYGIPVGIVSDRAVETSHVLRMFTQQHTISPSHSSSYHPQTNVWKKSKKITGFQLPSLGRVQAEMLHKPLNWPHMLLVENQPALGSGELSGKRNLNPVKNPCWFVGNVWTDQGSNIC